MSESRERDLILAPNEYAYILDETKGHVIAYIGPHKTSLANTDRPVTYDHNTRRFQRGNLEEAITSFPFAEEGWYVVLENPAREGDEEHPKGGPNNLPKLISGRKVNLPGPITFPLWPGQVARVIQGHHLRSNQYLVVRVYNEEAARDNWARAVIKPQQPHTEPVETEVPDLTMGKLLVIRGTDVSFYIPPTGVEVVPDVGGGGYVRAAVTLERLEYCILLDEDGNKRFIRGPAVVFPEPTETFVEKAGSRKFKAIELNELTGIYLKVIAPYTDEAQVAHKEGEELFLTGKEQMIYFPRPEHAIIKYGNQDIHHSVAIPAGNALYMLHRLTGEVSLVRGPAMFLPDPRREVVVRRVLPLHLVEMLYPGNHEALEYNRKLLQLTRPEIEYVADREVRAKKERVQEDAKVLQAAPRDFAGDELMRTQTYSKPRTITLDTRYEGAVSIDVWTGYAVLVVGKSGQRKVVVGPASYLLEYDESPEMVELSTGTPKTDEQLFRTVYLRVLNNTVSDIVQAETADLCQVRVQLSYRVNFEGDPERWFNVENYVKFLTDHMRSMLRNAIKSHGLEQFYQNAISVVRDSLLGAPVEGKRSGRRFEENGMHVYDVEVLDVTIGENQIADLLMKAQHHAVQQAIELAAEQRRLDATRKSEEIKQQIAEAVSSTTLKELALRSTELEMRAAYLAQEIRTQHETEMQRLQGKSQEQEPISRLHEAELARERARRDQELELAQRQLGQRLEELRAEVQGVVARAEAVSPDLIAALQGFSDRALAERMAETMAPLAILGGKSIGEVFAGLLKDTPLENVLKRNGGNGEPLALKPGS